MGTPPVTGDSQLHHEAARPLAGSEGWRGRFDEGVARVPFRVRIYVVYAVIAALFVLVFVAFQFDTDFMLEWLPFLLKGVPLSLMVTIGGIVLAVVLALIGALGRLSKHAIFQGPANFYVSFVRGTPLIVQIFFIYFAVPRLAFAPGMPEGMRSWFFLEPLTAGIIALGVNYGAYMAEIFRAGIQSVGGGQIEAAHALGMGPGMAMRRIVLPQAVRVIIPPTGNEFIAMIKDSALVSFMGLSELFFRATQLGRSRARPVEAFAVAALIYWFMTTVFSFFQAKVERRFARGHVREESVGH
jgi:polar amino acid transport system permease protein